MPYRFELRDTSLTDALRRLMQEELAPVQGHLAARGLAPDTVHDIRKRVKKCRALLRLLKPGLAGVQPGANARLRAAGQALAHQRDAAVRLATFDRLMAPVLAEPALADPATAAALATLRARLLDEAARPAPPPPDLSPLLGALLDEAQGWQVEGSERRVLAAGLCETRDRARRAMRLAREAGTEEALHDWRKRAKDLWYQARLFAPVWPEAMKPLVEAADRLCEALGDHHDLAVLGAHVATLPDDAAPPEARAALQAELLTASLAIESAAYPLGARLFAGDPEEMAELWVRWWRIWRAQMG